jgi:hypothetical protein
VADPSSRLVTCGGVVGVIYSGDVSNEAEVAAGPVVEKFASSIGQWLGFFGIAFGVVTAGAAALDDPPENWQVFLFGLAVIALSWVTLVRPSVALHQHGVLLRNMMRDSYVPASKIERCRTSQTLMIRTATQTFHGLGVSRSARSIMREQRGPNRGMMSALGGMSGGFGAGGPATPEPDGPQRRFANEEVEGPTYQSYVESRIEQVAHDAQPDDREPVVSWAVVPVATVALAVVCFALLLV